MTEGKTADVFEARKMRFEPGTLLVFDRGYSDYNWWLKVTRAGVNFVTRLKDSASHSPTFGIHVSQEPLRGGVTLFGRLADPSSRFGVILRLP